jgi:hypothetical protein
MVIKTLNVDNPFADYGSIVEGKRFVGRKSAIEAIHNRVLGSNYGNLAIMGLPRIGKSSLAWNALMTKKGELSKRKILIERINVGSISSSKEFYLKLMDKIMPNVRTLSFELYNQLSESRKIYNESNSENEIEFFFALVKQSNYRLIYVLDEFDNVTNFFKLQDFQLLRELSISPETKICLVTISRQTIQELEPDNGAISNFYGVFSDLRLGMFNEIDISEYWDWIKKQKIDISEEYIVKVKYLVGGHPYLIDQFNFYLLNELKIGTNTSWKGIIDSTASQLKLNLYNSLDSALRLLEIEKLYSKAFQLVLGPVYDVQSTDEEKLLKYEFIKKIDAEEKRNLLGYDMGVVHNGLSYICFSEYLTIYFKLKGAEIDFWPLWAETENTVRRLIKKYLKEKFGYPWEDNYLIKYPSENREMAINKLKRERDKYQAKFPDKASSHIVDYTYPKDMYDLFIANDWEWFGLVFGEGKQKKKEWAEKFNHLAMIRNPVAHNNIQFVPENQIQQAEIYCNELVGKIKAWEVEK